MSELAIVALGSNLGHTRDTIVRAMDRLQEFSDKPILRSSLYETEPVDCPPGTPNFLNAVIGLEARADETPDSLLEKLQTLENEFGRQPKKVLNESRPLDLDIIAFGQRTSNSPQLTLPHPRAHLRRFVLEPLSDIIPDFVLPGQSKPARELLNSLPED
ncbi:MAG: 7 8-dihydro-6-hydroxymethylpterin-pyrophosphokinae hppk [Verrucomicrobiales bacterium]|nr:7 8-dihydro-6-hydroxymethylpterin-pyrophosphokinae hppk [Verrucomicrobiales bacterium]